jgi:hypothetical protein
LSEGLKAIKDILKKNNIQAVAIGVIGIPVEEEAARKVFSGEIVNATAAAGVLAAHAAITEGRPTRPADAPWPDRPKAFAARQHS